jgi:anthranilate phosphoribosyltransferase
MMSQIAKLQAGQDLNVNEMHDAMSELLSDGVPDKEKAEFLRFLAKKGETNDELYAMLNKMDEFGLHIEPKCSGEVIDMCGTGGDKLSTFNISTTASFVVAASGGFVAKHGNRSVSGVSGSADIFEFFGYDLGMTPKKVTQILEKDKIAFLFAQKFHPSMKHVAAARKMLTSRTAFNLLGPLSNPARVKNQLVGVFSDEFLERIALILKRRNAQNVMTVHSSDGLDELSTGAKNKVCFLHDGKLQTMIVDPQDFGFSKSTIKDLQVRTKIDAIKAFLSVLDGTANRPMREITILNAAAGLIVANVERDFAGGIEIAKQTLESGRAYSFFERYIKKHGDVEKIREVQSR